MYFATDIAFQKATQASCPSHCTNDILDYIYICLILPPYRVPKANFLMRIPIHENPGFVVMNNKVGLGKYYRSHATF